LRSIVTKENKGKKETQSNKLPILFKQNKDELLTDFSNTKQQHNAISHACHMIETFFHLLTMVIITWGVHG